MTSSWRRRRAASWSSRGARWASRPRRAIFSRRAASSPLRSNPHQTFLDLLEPAHLPDDWRRKVEGFAYNLIAPLFALNLNLSEPPRYAAADNDSALETPFMVIMGLEHVAQYPEIVRHHEAGTIPPTVMWGACPTQFDPSQAPPRRAHRLHVGKAALCARRRSSELGTRRRTRTARSMLDLWRRHAPNLDGAVIDCFTRSPLDVERTLPNMRRGDLLVGAFTDGQIGADRPFPGAGRYRAHLDGLYLCGSASHPGGNVTGLPGYNAAQVLLADLGIEAGWAPPPIAERLAALADGG